MNNYYFTFGCDPIFPFEGGWAKVKANTKEEAIEKFDSHYPRINKNIINCAFIYTEEQFKRTRMYEKQDNGGRSCHKIID